jgi:hypothetical protein
MRLVPMMSIRTPNILHGRWLPSSYLDFAVDVLLCLHCQAHDPSTLDRLEDLEGLGLFGHLIDVLEQDSLQVVPHRDFCVAPTSHLFLLRNQVFAYLYTGPW